MANLIGKCSSGAEENIIHVLFVLIGDHCHAFRQGKDDMKIRDIEKFRFAFLQPLGAS